MSPRTTVSHSREFRPFRWLGMAAFACLVAFFAGVIAAGEQAHTSRDSSPAATCVR